MWAKCLKDCFCGRSFPDDGSRMLCRQGMFYDVPPQAPWAKFFSFAEKPAEQPSVEVKYTSNPLESYQPTKSHFDLT
jgi:hypothetical protein